MIVTRKARVRLLDAEYRIGQVVPPNTWNKLPPDRQRTLVAAGYFTQQEVEDTPRPAAKKRGS